MEGYEAILLEAIAKYMKEKKVTGFTKGISYVSSHAVDNRRTLGAADLELSKAFDTVSVGEI